MRKLATLITPLLVVGAFALNRGNVLDGRQALVAIVLVEGLLSARMFLGVEKVRRAYRESRASGLGYRKSAFEGLRSAGSGPFAALFVGELLIWRSLFRLVRGGWKLSENEFSYHRRSPLIGLVFVTVITAPAELLVIDLVVPWRTVRFVLLFLAIYSLLWILGYAAAQMCSPHRLTASELIVRKGFLAEARIPFSEIDLVERTSRNLPKTADRWGVAIIDGTAYYVIAGQADVVVHLRTPISVRRLLDDSEPCFVYRVAVDNPYQFVRLIGERMRPETPLEPAA